MLTKPELWRRISRYHVDEAESAFPFPARLARDNGWSRAFALEVIEEYKRYCYLALVSDHEVTPSDEVEQAWHVYPTYTRDFWGPFKQALGRPLHHGPTRGGARENARFEDNYSATLASYARSFSHPAPLRIWPPARVRFGNAPGFRRVRAADYWMVPKRALAASLAMFGAGLAGWHLLVDPVMAETTEDNRLPGSLEGWIFLGVLVVILMAIGYFAERKKGSSGCSSGGGCSTSGCGAGCGGD